jgi:hypothetical protein
VLTITGLGAIAFYVHTATTGALPAGGPTAGAPAAAEPAAAELPGILGQLLRISLVSTVVTRFLFSCFRVAKATPALRAILAAVTAGTFLVLARTGQSRPIWAWDLLPLHASMLMAGGCWVEACPPAHPGQTSTAPPPTVYELHHDWA